MGQELGYALVTAKLLAQLAAAPNRDLGFVRASRAASSALALSAARRDAVPHVCALENSEVFPLGERAPVRVDVRIIAATHRDLARLVREGKFREDLHYRLQVVPVVIPALRDRRADIPVLARHFLRELTRQGDPPVLAPDALATLLEQPFAGNVRELKNIIERALAYFPDPPVLRTEHLRPPAQ